jgi:hypothetical protein
MCSKKCQTNQALISHQKSHNNNADLSSLGAYICTKKNFIVTDILYEHSQAKELRGPPTTKDQQNGTAYTFAEKVFDVCFQSADVK